MTVEVRVTSCGVRGCKERIPLGSTFCPAHIAALNNDLRRALKHTLKRYLEGPSDGPEWRERWFAYADTVERCKAFIARGGKTHGTS